VSASYDGCFARDTIDVVVNSPDAGDEPDQEFCANATLLIGPSADPACIYQWNTGETTTPLLVSEGGTYILVCEQGPCFDFDTVTVTAVNPPVLALPDSLPWCFGFPTTMEVSGSSGPYVWSTGEGGSSIEVTIPGIYSVSTTVGPCTVQESVLVYEVAVCDPELEMPNAFSPNGDGINDFFTAYGNFVLDYRLSIYNRWGTLIFQSVDPSQVSQMNAGWDGTYKGVAQEAGTYLYHVSAAGRDGVAVELQGEVYLVR
jgi:gliding motility-associated-like protein